MLSGKCCNLVSVPLSNAVFVVLLLHRSVNPVCGRWYCTILGSVAAVHLLMWTLHRHIRKRAHWQNNTLYVINRHTWHKEVFVLCVVLLLLSLLLSYSAARGWKSAKWTSVARVCNIFVVRHHFRSHHTQNSPQHIRREKDCAIGIWFPWHTTHKCWRKKKLTKKRSSTETHRN